MLDIVRHQTVLTLLNLPDNPAYRTPSQASFGYTDWDDSDGGPGTRLHLNHGVWVELGQPQTLTLTLDPGDPLTAQVQREDAGDDV